jgi:hypothetical protein
MRTHACRLAFVVLATCLSWCSASCASPPGETPTSAAPPHHELHLPPVGSSVQVTFGGKSVEVVLATVPHEGSSALLVDVWKGAFPSEDSGSLSFDLVGSDGFHPASRPMCARPLTGADVATARIDIVTHNVSFGDASILPGCYRVKAVVRIDASR